MPIILNNITQRYPNAKRPLFDGLSANFCDGKTHAVLGASGSGKTTLLKIIAGLTDYKGFVQCENVSYVFQDARLINGITVRENLTLTLASVIKDKKNLLKTVDEYLALSETDMYADSFPDELSGGEQQRVSIARAFAYPAQTLLMDEPFSSLDYGVKYRLIKQFINMNKESPRTVIFVTHNADEAISLADNIYLLNGSPATLSQIETIEEPQESRDAFSEKYASLKKSLVETLKRI